jgi:plastocyanin
MSASNVGVVLTAVALAWLGAVPAAAGTITGTVKYQGKVPTLKPIAMDADPGCAAKHKTPVKSEVLVLGEGNALANVFVQIAGGLPAKTWPVASQPVVMDQLGCRYDPHVFGIMAGQELKILNSDGLLHNIHALPKVNKPFNMAMPANRTEAIEKFTKPEEMFKIKCDVHPWMNAYVAVLDHPFFDTSGTDGKFQIANLPAGTYDVVAWHEKLGQQKTKVTVTADGTATADFTFSPPSE